jgi:hypothetical protein
MKTVIHIAAVISLHLLATILHGQPTANVVASRWTGTWQGSDGHRFRFGLQLHAKGNQVEGRILWRLTATPRRSSLANRLGDSGTEYVQGTYQSNKRTFHLKGIRVSDRSLLATDEYSLVVSADGRRIEGRSRGNRNDWKSEVRGVQETGTGETDPEDNRTASPRSKSSESSSERTQARTPTHKGLIRELLQDCQNQLLRTKGIPLPETGRAMRALGDLCPESDVSQRIATRSALHLMVDDDFLEQVKRHGSMAALAPGIKAAAIVKDPSLAGSCLLTVIDETVRELLTNPFGL